MARPDREPGVYEEYMGLGAEALACLIDRAADIPRNYILDATKCGLQGVVVQCFASRRARSKALAACATVLRASGCCLCSTD